MYHLSNISESEILVLQKAVNALRHSSHELGTIEQTSLQSLENRLFIEVNKKSTHHHFEYRTGRRFEPRPVRSAEGLG